VVRPATYADQSYRVIPNRPVLTFYVPATLVPNVALLSGAVEITAQGSRVVSLAILGG
jgi:hypothetical protein